jgi:hypothetical protein
MEGNLPRPGSAQKTDAAGARKSRRMGAPFRAPERLEQIGEAVLAYIANQVPRPSHHLRSAGTCLTQVQQRCVVMPRPGVFSVWNKTGAGNQN